MRSAWPHSAFARIVCAPSAGMLPESRVFRHGSSLSVQWTWPADQLTGASRIELGPAMD